MNILGVIPARYGSTRFPGKPLCMIAGKSMIRRVYEQAMSCKALSRVVVATDDETIHSHVAGFGGESILTGSHHKSGTERCGEVVHLIRKSANDTNLSYDVILNIQGDEPFIHPRQIEAVALAFRDPAIQISTLARAIHEPGEWKDPNVVKVVFDLHHRALYFSRSAIPFVRNPDPANPFKAGLSFAHVGLYGYRETILMNLLDLPVTPLEEMESLEQLRWLQHGYSIHIRITDHHSISIDTPADLEKIINNNI